MFVVFCVKAFGNQQEIMQMLCAENCIIFRLHRYTQFNPHTPITVYNVKFCFKNSKQTPIFRFD